MKTNVAASGSPTLDGVAGLLISERALPAAGQVAEPDLSAAPEPD